MNLTRKNGECTSYHYIYSSLLCLYFNITIPIRFEFVIYSIKYYSCIIALFHPRNIDKDNLYFRNIIPSSGNLYELQVWKVNCLNITR